MNTIDPVSAKMHYEAASPNGKIALRLDVGDQLAWSVQFAGQPMILPSPISL
jgi:hypothetical protein